MGALHYTLLCRWLLDPATAFSRLRIVYMRYDARSRPEQLMLFDAVL
jgi:hypothetical protein